MKKETGFNELVRKVRKELFGKGPERIQTSFVDNLAISILYGNLTQTEKFFAQEPNGRQMVKDARTQMIQKVYPIKFQPEFEAYMDNKMLYLFTDINVEQDVAVSVFVFQDKINP
ncbi:DUF2294 domain-containing protein [Paenibacillus physcomitrellae]|uniref:Na+-translocating membrane potential-generating system MpsC domain-containing protein n=1 Tax=Paenibacillus physcomitrellae TaxID=1619311 RepID=A0ABQ1GCC2_9BACL|nr:DUF2294 domain-containing protein [Paenibacillus physcomitrellae]GGA40937.1 hypothetical protein GCM10010917_27740 [Paenibacillus physcomitrellae]